MSYDEQILTLNRLIAQFNPAYQDFFKSLPLAGNYVLQKDYHGKLEELITEPEDLPLPRQWKHVLASGFLLAVILFKRYFRGRSALADAPVLTTLATTTTLVAGYPILRSGLETLTKRGKISHDLVISLAAYLALTLRENALGLFIIWAINLTSLLQSLALSLIILCFISGKKAS